MTQRRLVRPNHAQALEPDSTPQGPAQATRPVASTHSPVLPRRVSVVSGETLTSYLARLATVNHLTVSEILTVLPTWFTTKANNPDERSQHHMLAPATTEALHALARLTRTDHAGLARALPAFGSTGTHGPVRFTVACPRCTARRGIHQTVPISRPVHDRVCTRHGVWLSDSDQPYLDISACPEIIKAQRRVDRLLRRHTAQQLTLAHQAASDAIPAWPASPAAIAFHWRHRLLILQTTNHHRGIPDNHNSYTQAAIYPDAISRAAVILNPHRLPRV